MSTHLLDSLEIRSFRPFRHLVIERLGRVSLVVGKNNVGKTCLLEAVWLWASGGWHSVARNLLHARDELSLDYEDDLRQLLHHGELGSHRTTSLYIGPIKSGDHPQPRLEVQFQAEGRPVAVKAFAELRDRSTFVPAHGLDPSKVNGLWDQIALTPAEKDVLEALRILVPDVEGIALVNRPEGNDRIPMIKTRSRPVPIPLRSMGGGVSRVFAMILSLVTTRNGIVLFDEIENGLHYTIQTDLWRVILRLAKELNIQVLATSHSWDCIEAFQAGARDVGDDQAVLIRLEEREKRAGEIRVTCFDVKELAIATREAIEVR